MRPAEHGPFRPLYAIEDAAAETVHAIRAVQLSGPYILGGLCQGGLVAFEAGLRLEQLGERVLLVLLDTPFPGGAHLVQQWDAYANSAREKVKRAGEASTLRPLLRSAGSLLRRASWLAVRRMRPVMSRLWSFASIRKLCAWSSRNNFSFYRPGKVEMPMLHFIATKDEFRVRAASKLRLASITEGAVRNCELPGDHDSFLDEANLPTLSRVLESWLAERLSTNKPRDEQHAQATTRQHAVKNEVLLPALDSTEQV